MNSRALRRTPLAPHLRGLPTTPKSCRRLCVPALRLRAGRLRGAAGGAADVGIPPAGRQPAARVSARWRLPAARRRRRPVLRPPGALRRPRTRDHWHGPSSQGRLASMPHYAFGGRGACSLGAGAARGAGALRIGGARLAERGARSAASAAGAGHHDISHWGKAR